MAEIKYTIPNNKIAKVVDAFAEEFEYQVTLTDGSNNPETKAQFTKRMILNYIMSVVKKRAEIEAINAARLKSNTDIEKDIVIT
jgi:hypothetical protein